MPDRIETATFLVAAAITKGKLTLTHTRPDTIKVIIDKLKKAGADIQVKNDIINIDVKSQLDAVNIQLIRIQISQQICKLSLLL